MHLHRVGALIFLIRTSVQEPNLTLGSLYSHVSVVHSSQSNAYIPGWIFILLIAEYYYLYTLHIFHLKGDVVAVYNICLWEVLFTESLKTDI